jgi:isopentenyl phosphate kinase
MDESVIYLKLGGSLITDKNQPYFVEQSTLDRISSEINRFLCENPNRKLIIGHGSGSFGHTSATKYHTLGGVATKEEWIGFQKVCFDARSLNQIVMQSLQKANVPAVSFPPSAQVTASNRTIQKWDTSTIQNALEHHLIPVIFGDTVLDTIIGGTILSTEEFFIHLARDIAPSSILLAGVEDGVWENFPSREKLIEKITPTNYPSIKAQIMGSVSTDVTGGMTTKIEKMLTLLQAYPEINVQVFSGAKISSVYSALSGNTIGTLIFNNKKG